METQRSPELAYRRAFQEFADKVKRVQSLAENPNSDRRAVEAAELDVELARSVYNSARDAWVKCLLPDGFDDEPCRAETASAF